MNGNLQKPPHHGGQTRTGRGGLREPETGSMMGGLMNLVRTLELARAGDQEARDRIFTLSGVPVLFHWLNQDRNGIDHPHPVLLRL